MKNIFAVILAVMILTGISFAQIGVMVGANVTNFKGASELKLNTRTGITAGLYLDFPESGFGFMPAILYSQKGATLTSSVLEDGVPVNIDATMKYDYIEIPVLVRYTLETHTSFRPFLLAGPYLGILVSSRMAGTGSSAGVDPITVETDITNQRTFDYGFAYGGGVRFDLGNISMNINLRYSIGMLAADKGQLKNSGFSIMAGLLL
jgi:hypothetical protein